MKVRGFNNNSSNAKFSNAAGGQSYNIELTNASGGTRPCTVDIDSNRNTTTFTFTAASPSERFQDGTVICTIGGNQQTLAIKTQGLVYSMPVELGYNDPFTLEGTSVGGDFSEFGGMLADAIAELMETSLAISDLTVQECGDKITFNMSDLGAMIQVFPQLQIQLELQLFLTISVVYPNFTINSLPINIQGGSLSDSNGAPNLGNSVSQVVVTQGIDNYLQNNMQGQQLSDALNSSPIYYSFQFSSIGGEDFGYPQILYAEGAAAYNCGTSTAIQGCTYTDAENYDATATQDDGSCTFADGTGYDGGDVETEVYGCTDSTAVTFNALATVDDGSCQYYTAQGDPVGDAAGLVSALALTNSNYEDLINDTIYLIQQLQGDLATAQAVTPEDGVNQGDVDAVQGLLDSANAQLSELQGADGMLSAVQATIEDIAAAPCNLEDPATDATFFALTEAGVGAQTITALQTLCTGNDGVTQANVDAATSDLANALDIIENILDSAVPENDSDVSTSNMYSLEISIQEAIDLLQAVVPEDGASVADLNAANNLADSLQTQLDDAIANGSNDVAAIQAQLDAAIAEINDLAVGINPSSVTYTQDGVGGTIYTQAAEDLSEVLSMLASAYQTLNSQYPTYEALELQISNAIQTIETALSGEGVDIEVIEGIENYANSVSTLVDSLSDTAGLYDSTLVYDQADWDAAYADGAASITPEDGISSAEVDQAYIDGQNSITPEDGISQADVDAAFDDGVASVEQDYTLAEIDAAFADGAASVEQDFTQADLDQSFADGAASVVPEDGITQDNVNAAFDDGVASVTYLQSSYDDGVASVDITTDNQGAIDAATAEGEELYNSIFSAGAASITAEDGITQVEVDAAYDDGYNVGYGVGETAGVSSVDITTDNQGAIDDAMALLGVGDATYDSIFGAGVTSVDPALAELQSALDAATAALTGGDSGAAWDLINEQLDLAQEQLADAELSNETWGDFLSTLDTSMSRLERFLADSYSYTNYDRGTLSIPEDMSTHNPNFENETPSMSSTYVGDGTDFGNTTSYQAGVDSGEFGEFSGSGKKKVNSITNFSYMMGKANHIQEGFMNYSGDLPFSRMDGDDNDDDDDEGMTLTTGTKTGLWVFGGALVAFGLYKVLKKK